MKRLLGTILLGLATTVTTSAHADDEPGFTWLLGGATGGSRYAPF